MAVDFKGFLKDIRNDYKLFKPRHIPWAASNVSYLFSRSFSEHQKEWFEENWNDKMQHLFDDFKETHEIINGVKPNEANISTDTLKEYMDEIIKDFLDMYYKDNEDLLSEIRFRRAGGVQPSGRYFFDESDIVDTERDKEKLLSIAKVDIDESNVVRGWDLSRHTNAMIAISFPVAATEANRKGCHRDELAEALLAVILEKFSIRHFKTEEVEKLRQDMLDCIKLASDIEFFQTHFTEKLNWYSVRMKSETSEYLMGIARRIAYIRQSGLARGVW